jgi:hypothetical protein
MALTFDETAFLILVLTLQIWFRKSII